jgi:hypothetical protein
MTMNLRTDNERSIYRKAHDAVLKGAQHFAYSDETPRDRDRREELADQVYRRQISEALSMAKQLQQLLNSVVRELQLPDPESAEDEAKKARPVLEKLNSLLPKIYR